MVPTCKFCAKEFTQNFNLNKHYRNVHAVNVIYEKPFSCAHCPNSFSYKRSLIIHLRKKHDIDGDAGKKQKKKKQSK
jgi:uncharacterized Zn-finger protein